MGDFCVNPQRDGQAELTDMHVFVYCS